LDDVRGRVHVDGIVYAGSHGFDIAGAGGLRRELGAAYLPVLDKAEKELREALDEIPGAQLERKHFSVAAHYRNVNEKGRIQSCVSGRRSGSNTWRTAQDGRQKSSRTAADIDWNKGKAMLWLLETLGLDDQNALPIYIGDDRTDEDAFRALEKRGIGILVSEQPQVTAASYWLNHPDEVERFLGELIARLPSWLARI
jgi:trehalose-phosphatase